MSYRWLDHVVIVVRDIEQATRDYERLLGIPADDTGKDFPDRGFRHSLFRMGESRSLVELCQPTDTTKQAGGAMQKKLARSGEGVHNIALAVDDIDTALADARARGLDVIPSAHSRSFFLHPNSTHGVLIQIVERR